jgi:hypothetical protein
MLQAKLKPFVSGYAIAMLDHEPSLSNYTSCQSRYRSEAQARRKSFADYLATQSSLDRAEQFLNGIDSTLQRLSGFDSFV